MLMLKYLNDNYGFIIPAGCDRKCLSCCHLYIFHVGNACDYGMGNACRSVDTVKSLVFVQEVSKSGM